MCLTCTDHCSSGEDPLNNVISLEVVHLWTGTEARAHMPHHLGAQRGGGIRGRGQGHLVATCYILSITMHISSLLLLFRSEMYKLPLHVGFSIATCSFCRYGRAVFLTSVNVFEDLTLFVIRSRCSRSEDFWRLWL